MCWWLPFQALFPVEENCWRMSLQQTQQVAERLGGSVSELEETFRGHGGGGAMHNGSCGGGSYPTLVPVCKVQRGALPCWSANCTDFSLVPTIYEWNLSFLKVERSRGLTGSRPQAPHPESSLKHTFTSNNLHPIKMMG